MRGPWRGQFWARGLKSGARVCAPFLAPLFLCLGRAAQASEPHSDFDWRVTLDQSSIPAPWFGLWQQNAHIALWSAPETSALQQPSAQSWASTFRPADVSYQKDWSPAFGRTASGLEVSLTPHTGMRHNTYSTTAEAGATLRVGRNLRDLAQDGYAAFGERPRWYVFAAGSKRAVGYNLTRGRDGDLDRAGITHDEGGTFGDASIGVAYRRGMIQSSFGIFYRENETKGLRSFEGVKTDVDEGIVAFQFSIRPR